MKPIIFIWGVVLIVFILNLLRTILVYRDIKSTFYCKHCGNFNDEICLLDKCKQCNRTISFKSNNWRYFLLHRENGISSFNKSMKYVWKDYKKVCITELTLNIVAIIIFIAAIALEFLV